jgi:hypothetical protein
MIILEGPDGAGKSTLLDQLIDAFPSIESHERASTSVGGPVDNIFDWALADVETWNMQPLSFYDRHPLVSEPIYGNLLRGGVDERFGQPEGQQLYNKLHNRALIVYCLPQVSTVVKNVRKNVKDQMSGVSDQIHSIYLAYQHRLITHGEVQPHTAFHYDYEADMIDEFDDLCEIVEAHLTRWTRKSKGRIA